jgi:hypothetical protein
MATNATARRKHLPLDRRIGAVEDFEDTAFVLEEALNRGSGEDEKILELAQMKQTHDGVNISTENKDAGDGGVSRQIGIGRKLRGGDDLCTEIGGSANQKPESGQRRESNLRLRARTCSQRACAETRTIVASAIPLRKPAARG